MGGLNFTSQMFEGAESNFVNDLFEKPKFNDKILKKISNESCLPHRRRQLAGATGKGSGVSCILLTSMNMLMIVEL